MAHHRLVRRRRAVSSPASLPLPVSFGPFFWRDFGCGCKAAHGLLVVGCKCTRNPPVACDSHTRHAGARLLFVRQIACDLWLTGAAPRAAEDRHVELQRPQLAAVQRRRPGCVRGASLCLLFVACFRPVFACISDSTGVANERRRSSRRSRPTWSSCRRSAWRRRVRSRAICMPLYGSILGKIACELWLDLEAACLRVSGFF